MLRFAELALFLSPFLLFLAWRVAAYAGWPSTRVVASSFALLVVLIGALLWLQRQGALPTGAPYVPAALHDGRIVPAHGAAP